MTQQILLPAPFECLFWRCCHAVRNPCHVLEPQVGALVHSPGEPPASAVANVSVPSWTSSPAEPSDGTSPSHHIKDPERRIH